MRCPVCGEEATSGAPFCNHCGTDLRKINDNQSFHDEDSSQESDVDNGEYECEGITPYFGTDYEQDDFFDNGYENSDLEMDNQAKKKKLMIGIGIGVAALVAVIVLIVVLVMVAGRKHEIDLSQYVTVSFNGYNGYGEATVQFDDEQFNADIEQYGKQPRKKSSYFIELMDEYIDLGAVLKQDAGVSYSLDRYSELSNGDTVILTFDFNQEVANTYNIELVGEEIEYEVEELEEVEELDVFQDINVVFDGISPNITAQIVNNSSDEKIQNLSFSLDKESGIQKGDKVTVSIDSSEDEFIETYGCHFKEQSKTYECTAANEYIKKLDDIPKNTMSDMKNQTKDVIDSYFAYNQEDFGHGEYKYEGCYLLTSKADNEYTNNIVYIVYSTKVSSKSEEDSFDSKTIYMPVKYTNVIKYADGTGYVDLNSTEILGRTNLEPSWKTVNGYDSKTKMYNELVASQKAEFHCESSEEIE